MKKMSELNKKELEKVFYNNNKLQENVLDDMLDNADFWNGEYLNSWDNGSVDYSIGRYMDSYFASKNNKLFIEGLKEVQRIFCFLPDEYNNKIKYVGELIPKLEYLYYNGSDKNYNQLENRIDELINELENACYKRFMSEYDYCYDSKNQLEYFIDFYVSERMDNTFYIDENYNLFQHIEYIKSYN